MKHQTSHLTPPNCTACLSNVARSSNLFCQLCLLHALLSPYIRSGGSLLLLWRCTDDGLQWRVWGAPAWGRRRPGYIKHQLRNTTENIYVAWPTPQPSVYCLLKGMVLIPPGKRSHFSKFQSSRNGSLVWTVSPPATLRLWWGCTAFLDEYWTSESKDLKRI